MAKKDLSHVTTDLAELARNMPVQRPPARVGAASARTPSTEPMIQFGFRMRKSLRKELSRLSDDADLTMGAFVLLALREKGLSVTEDDLLDLRKRGEEG